MTTLPTTVRVRIILAKFQFWPMWEILAIFPPRVARLEITPCDRVRNMSSNSRGLYIIKEIKLQITKNNC